MLEWVAKENPSVLSITSIYASDDGNALTYLHRIADAGFSHVLWSHHGYDDFMYDAGEIQRVRTWLKETGLALLDVHGSIGIKKVWCSPDEHQRRAGVELVKNRLELAARLSGQTVIMHTGAPDPSDPEPFWEAIHRSLDELEPFARVLGVRIALENGTWAVVRPLLAAYSPAFVGHCYDSGHGNLDEAWGLRTAASEPPGVRLGAGYHPGDEGGLGGLEQLRDRLICIHLHDNDGASDSHMPLFSGTVDWARLARILAASSYTGPVSLETVMAESGCHDEAAFLAHAFDTGTRFAEMIRMEV